MENAGGRRLEYKGCVVSQSEVNGHVSVFKDGKQVFHAQVDKVLTDDDLREYVDFYIQLSLDIYY